MKAAHERPLDQADPVVKVSKTTLHRYGCVTNQMSGQFSNFTVHATKSRICGVTAADVQTRPRIEKFPVCPSLNQYQLVHVGIMETTAPTRIVRTRQTTTYFLACFGGKGKVLIDGRWRICRT